MVLFSIFDQYWNLLLICVTNYLVCASHILLYFENMLFIMYRMVGNLNQMDLSRDNNFLGGKNNLVFYFILLNHFIHLYKIYYLNYHLCNPYLNIFFYLYKKCFLNLFFVFSNLRILHIQVCFDKKLILVFDYWMYVYFYLYSIKN